MASRDDSIHLNGTNTDKNPYTCKPGASAYPGILIDKALSLIGYGNQLAWIQCSGGNSLTFNGTSASQRMRTKMSNIGFKGGAMNFLDSSAHIKNALFEDSTGVNLIINKMMSSLHIADSTFSKNKGCISVTSSINQNITFNLTLENVTLSQNEFSNNGLVFLDVKSGSHNIHFQNVAFKDNQRGWPRVLYNNECIVKSLQAAVKILIHSSYFRGGDARLFQISGSDISLFIHNSSFVGHKVSEGYGSGAVLSLSGNNHPQQSISLNVSNSSFVNTSADQCGAVNVQCVGACSTTFLDCIFIGNIAERGSGGAVCISMVSKRYRSAHKTTTNTALKETSSVAVPDPFHVSIQRCTFFKNKANLYDAGAVSILAGSRTSIILQEVTIESNWARNFGGAISVYANENASWDDRGTHHRNVVDSLEECNITIAFSNFSNNAAGRVGGAIYLKGNIPVNLFLEKVSMKSNTGYLGGAVYVETRPVKSDKKAFILMIENSIFSNNEAKGKGGACYIDANKKQALLFEDTIFENNEASFGGVLHLSNGNATFQSCSFIDNIASTLGGHLHTAAGYWNLTILDSIFNQTVFKLHGSGNRTAGTFFVDTEGTGTLYITNTSLTATFPETNGPLVQVKNGRQVSLDNSTKLFCPKGSRMQIINFQGNISDRNVQTVQISCSSCEGYTYSLSRGFACGLHLGPTFSCARCPFGANCTRLRNIFAEPNFWGFEEETDPSLLKFVTCPLGYCRPPSEADFPEYNSCQGNRTGTMCGRCKESYTETLYSPTCRPVGQCNDYWVWPLAFVYVSMVAFYFTFKPPVVTWTKRQILWFRGQTQQNQDENFDRGFMKIIFYFYQAANLVLVPESTQHILKTDFVGTIIGLFNFKQTISPGKFPCPFPGLNVLTKRLLQASSVIGTMLMIPVFYTLHWGIKKIQRREAPSIGPYMGGFLQTLLLGYASLASVSFDLLHCVPVGSKTRLFFDGNIECYTSWQYIFMIVDSVFFVPFLFVLLWGSFKLYSGTVSVKHFLIACCFPLPSLIYWAISAMFCRERHLAKLEEPPARQASKIFVERVLYEPFKPPEEGNKLSLSWEGFLIGRRLILIVLNATIHDQLTRLCTISFVSVLFLLHHCTTQPYRDGIANKVETISLLCLVLLATINTFLASFPSFGITLDSTNPFTPSAKAFKIVEITILCFLPVIACFLLISALLSLVCRLVLVLYRTICRWMNSCYRNQDEAASPLLV